MTAETPEPRSPTSPADIPEAIRALLSSEKLAVLATQCQGQPHTSLVAFAATADAREIIFATTRASRKFANLRVDKRAALLMDSRSHHETDFHQAQALAAYGNVVELTGVDRDSRLHLFLLKHPHLSEFSQSPTSALMSFQVKVYNLASKFQKVIEYRL